MKTLLALILTIVITGCVSTPDKIDYYKDLPPQQHATPTSELLVNLPALDGEVITIAVYSFLDETGQRKPSDKFSQLSTAISQGVDVWVIQALKEAGSPPPLPLSPAQVATCPHSSGIRTTATCSPRDTASSILRSRAPMA